MTGRHTHTPIHGIFYLPFLYSYTNRRILLIHQNAAVAMLCYMSDTQLFLRPHLRHTAV